MTNLPPSGLRTVPSRARKSSSGVPGGFGSALKAGVENVSKPDDAPKAPKKQPQIRIARQTYNSLIATKILRYAFVSFLGFMLLYLCFAVTIMRVVPSVSIGPVLTKNITFPGGLIPEGTTVLVDVTGPQGSEMLDYLRQAFVPTNTVAVMKVHGGPWGTFNWQESGVVSYDGKILDMTIPARVNDDGVVLDVPATPRGDTKLENEYLMTCVEGACVPGQGYVFKALNIMGQPIGRG